MTAGTRSVDDMAHPVDNNFAEADDDGLLTAYLDGALPAPARAALETRLAAEPALQARLDRLGRGGRDFRAAFDRLLAAAPEEKLAAMLVELSAKHAGARSASHLRLGWAMAFAAALAIFAAGGIAGYVLPMLTHQPAQPPGWRQVVAEYQGLTTTATLAAIPENVAMVSEELGAIGGKLALDLTQDKLTLPNAALKRAQLFEFRGRPLVQLAYLTVDNGPVALCIIANGRPDEARAFEIREGFNIVFWTYRGHGYMLIGKVPRATLEAYADDLAARV